MLRSSMHLSSNRSQVRTIKMCVGLSLYKLHSEERMSMLPLHILQCDEDWHQNGQAGISKSLSSVLIAFLILIRENFE